MKLYLSNIIILQNTFNVSIVRIKVARSTIGYSEVDYWSLADVTDALVEFVWTL